MSEIMDLTKNSISNCNLRQHAFFANIFVRTVLTDLLHTSGASPGFGRGGPINFFPDLEICMSQSDMLRMAKPCALLEGFGACPPPRNFFKMVQFGAFWCIF